MKIKLLKGIILLLTGIITIAGGLVIVDKFTSADVIVMKDILIGIGAALLMVLGVTEFCMGWIYIRIFLDKRK